MRNGRAIGPKNARRRNVSILALTPFSLSSNRLFSPSLQRIGLTSWRNFRQTWCPQEDSNQAEDIPR